MLQTYRCIVTIRPEHLDESHRKVLETETERMWGMRTETVPVIVGALGLIREGMDQNLGKISGDSNIN